MVALVWEGIGEFLNSLNLDKFQMVVYGYVAVALLQTFVKEIIEIFLALSECKDDGEPCNELIRVLVEDVYIGCTTAAVILVWKGQPY